MKTKLKGQNESTLSHCHFQVALDWGLVPVRPQSGLSTFSSLVVGSVLKKSVVTYMVGAAGLIEEQNGDDPATFVFKRGCHVHLLFYGLLPEEWEGVEEVTMVENVFHNSFLLDREHRLLIVICS